MLFLGENKSASSGKDCVKSKSEEAGMSTGN